MKKTIYSLLAAAAITASTSAFAQNSYMAPTPYADQSVTAGMVKTFDVVMGSETLIQGLKNAGQEVTDWRANDIDRNLWIWDGTFSAGDTSYPGIGYTDMQYDEYVTLVIGTVGWSGAGFTYLTPGVNTRHWTDETRFHIAYRSAGTAPSSLALVIGDEDGTGAVPARIALGKPFQDGGMTYPTAGNAVTGEWQALDISFAELKKLYPSFQYSNVSGWIGNVLSILGGGITNQEFSIDAIYFYTPKEEVGEEPHPFYITGANVNGNEWLNGQPDAKFTYKGNGIYVWEGQFLSTGFKINDGTWDDDMYNIGSNGSDISLNKPYYYSVSGSSQNIAFDNFTELYSPVVTLNTVDNTITISGEPVGEYTWYIPGINNDFSLGPKAELYKTGIPGVYERNVKIDLTTGGFKISDTGWSHEYGLSVYSDYQAITLSNPTVKLTNALDGMTLINYDLPVGEYNVVVNFNEMTVTFTWVGDVEESYYYVVDDTGYLRYLSDIGDDTYYGQPFSALSGGVWILKQNVLNGTFKSNEWFGISDPLQSIAVGETVTLAPAEFGTFPMVPFKGFDLLNHGEYLFDANNCTLTIYSGNEYMLGSYSDDSYPDLYLISSDVNGESVSEPTESAMLQAQGNGVYTWEGKSLGAFRIINAYDIPRFTVGTTRSSLELDKEFIVNVGAGVSDIWINDIDVVENPSLVLDLNRWSLILSQDTSLVDRIESEDLSEAVYYDMTGLRVDRPVNGQIYIRINNGKVVKLVKSDKN